MTKTIFFILLGLGFVSCVNKESDINRLLLDELEENAEYAYNGHLFYSDSARIKVKLDYKDLKKFQKNREDFTEFPSGIYVEFYDENQKAISWLSSKYAIRNDQEGTMIARDSVVLYNIDNDKLVTSELIWEEKEEIIRTDKYVRITQPMQGDTSYGYGLVAKQDFSEFEIGRFSGKGTIKGLEKN